MRNSPFGLRFHKTLGRRARWVWKPQRRHWLVLQPDRAHFGSLNLDVQSPGHTQRNYTLCTAQIIWSWALQKIIASYLMLENKTQFIKSLRCLFLAAVIEDSLNRREFQYFSFHQDWYTLVCNVMLQPSACTTSPSPFDQSCSDSKQK